jgi:hypothetical protein
VELREERPRERRSVALTRRRRIGGVRQARRGRERWGSGPACRAAGRQRPGNAGHGRVGMAAQKRGGGVLMCGPTAQCRPARSSRVQSISKSI